MKPFCRIYFAEQIKKLCGKFQAVLSPVYLYSAHANRGGNLAKTLKDCIMENSEITFILPLNETQVSNLQIKHQLDLSKRKKPPCENLGTCFTLSHIQQICRNMEIHFKWKFSYWTDTKTLWPVEKLSIMSNFPTGFNVFQNLLKLWEG